MASPRVLFLTSGPNVPSTRYRIFPYLPRLRELGIECDVAHSCPEKYQRFPAIGWRASHVLRGLMRRMDLVRARRRKYDVIVIERELFDDPTSSLEKAFRRVTKRLVLDIDDAIFLRYPEKFARIAGMCDQILAGNRFLAEECQKSCPRVAVIPTAIDLNDYVFSQPRSPNPAPVIGWIGTAANLPNLAVALPALQQLARRYRFVLRIVTSDEHEVRKLPLQGLTVEFRRWSAAAATSDIRQFDIGIMPLRDSAWERYKCGFKLLQYMACARPAVASPVGVNSDIITHAVDGFLAHTTQDWQECLAQILDDPGRMASVGEAARGKIERVYSVDVQLPHVVAALLETGRT